MSTFPQAIPERREHLHIREIFVSACDFIAPTITGNDVVKTVSSFAMTHMLMDRFPELTAADAQIIIATVEKMHREDRLNAILNKK